GPNRAAECYFRDGRLDLVRLPDSRPLVETLTEADVLSLNQSDRLKRYPPRDDAGTVELLGELGYAERPRILAVLREQAAEAVRTIFRWDRGTFRLDDTTPPPEGHVPLGLDVQSLLPEAVAPPGSAVS